MKHQGKRPGPWDAEVELWPEPDRQWATRAGLAMTWFDAEDAAIVPILAEVRESVAASGQGPGELFGEPEAYGRKMAKGLRPAGMVLEGKLLFRTVGGGLKIALLSLGALLLAIGLWVCLDDGWVAHSLAGPGLLLFVLLPGLMGLAVWGWVIRTRGRLRAALVTWGGAACGFAGAIWLMTVLDDYDFVGPANWVQPVAGIALAALGLLLPDSQPPALPDDTGWDDGRWFAHAENLLRGRYHFTRVQAREGLREARQHRALAGRARSAASEFGHVEVFAAQLAALDDRAITRSIVLRRLAHLAALLWFLAFFIVPDFVEDAVTWKTILQAALWTAWLSWLLASCRKKTMQTDATRLKRSRDSDARSLRVSPADD
ncbi:hypothetical protein [Paeniglutamicibacter sp.]|uniref:hypothetical protein n=1 Tax=Paeniglutamicibacter sp. TaxID=1934391 RepID=UPI00398A2EA2